MPTDKEVTKWIEEVDVAARLIGPRFSRRDLRSHAECYLRGADQPHRTDERLEIGRGTRAEDTDEFAALSQQVPTECDVGGGWVRLADQAATQGGSGLNCYGS